MKLWKKRPEVELSVIRLLCQPAVLNQPALPQRNNVVTIVFAQKERASIQVAEQFVQLIRSLQGMVQKVTLCWLKVCKPLAQPLQLVTGQCSFVPRPYRTFGVREAEQGGCELGHNGLHAGTSAVRPVAPSQRLHPCIHVGSGNQAQVHSK